MQHVCTVIYLSVLAYNYSHAQSTCFPQVEKFCGDGRVGADMHAGAHKAARQREDDDDDDEDPDSLARLLRHRFSHSLSLSLSLYSRNLVLFLSMV